ncbi:MAG TPA: VWA domain-containing protein [Thermoanaerobaculia bacterium]|nr:VWA domain-containing protein [Thermoanaerobaculia bacterium]
MKKLLFTLLFAAGAAAQQPYIESFEVRLHNLDVVVTDREGQPVRGLTKDDFIVTENGVEKDISNFAVYDVRASKVAAQPDAVEDPAAPVAPPPRRFVFFIDEIGVQYAARKRLYENVLQFVRAMRDGDVASVIRPTTQEKVVQQFTGDRAALERALKEAIDESRMQATGAFLELHDLQLALSRAGSPPEVRFAKRAYADAQKRRVAHRLGQLRALASSLAGLEGRKVLVLVTMGISANPGMEAWDYEEQLRILASEGDDPERVYGPRGIVADYVGEIDEIARTAAANGVTIYALEPDVPLTLLARGRADVPTKERSSDLSFGNDPELEVSRYFLTDLLQNSEITLTSLTEKTGGRWFRGIGEIDDTFRQVSEDLSVYYSLAYHVSGEEDDPRRVDVRVRNRPELRVRTRSEVLEKSTEREMEDLVIASLLYPRNVNELAIAASTGKPKKTRGFYEIPIDIVIPLRNLAFVPAREGNTYVATFALYFAAAGQRSDFAAGGQQSQQIEITADQYQQIDTVNYRYKTGIEVAPGNMRIALGVIDETSKLTGFQTVDVVAQ